MNEINEPLTRQAEAAFSKATESVIRTARQTGTPILIWDQGRICEIPVEKMPPGAVEATSSPHRQHHSG